MFLALHAPVRGVQKDLSHEVDLFSVPKKLSGVKLFFSLFLAFFVHEKADMYPVRDGCAVCAFSDPFGCPEVIYSLAEVLAGDITSGVASVGKR